MEKFKANEKELALLKEKLRISTSLVKIGFWELNRTSQKIKLSDEAKLILRYTDKSNELTIDEFCALAPEDDSELTKASLHLLIDRKKNLDIEFSLLNKPGANEIFIKAIANCNIESKEIPHTIIGIVQDVTEQKKAELVLKKAKEKAEEADVLKSAFLANMSHEIRTPLNAILGFSKLLTDPNLENNLRKEYSEYITSSANNLLNLIRDIVDVSKIEAGKITLEKSTCLVNKTLRELKFTFDREKNNLSKQYIDIQLNMANDDEKFAIKTDPFRFNQILVNLIGNALKFIESGFIEFGYVTPSKNLLQFYVKDTGIGIPADKVDLIFSRFGQIINNEIKNPGGTGLGLSITKHLVEHLGGTIWVESEKGVGTTFYFTLPYEPIKDKGNEHISSGENFDNLNIKELKILAVEDDLVNMILLEDILKIHVSNLQLTKAFNGIEAIEQLKKDDFDIIIMDIRMSKMDGYTATEKIRKEFAPPKSETPILGLSAHALANEQEKGKKIGMTDFLPKPIKVGELLQKIKKLISPGQNPKDPAVVDDKYNQLPDSQLVDLSFFLKLFKNNRAKISKTLKEYQKQVPLQVTSLKEFLKAGEKEKLKTQAHSLKSTFKYIGRPDLSNIARQIEMFPFEDHNDTGLVSLINKIEKEWREISSEINHLIAVLSDK